MVIPASASRHSKAKQTTLCGGDDPHRKWRTKIKKGDSRNEADNEVKGIINKVAAAHFIRCRIYPTLLRHIFHLRTY